MAKSIVPTHKAVLDELEDIYDRRIGQFGPTAKGVFWKNEKWQMRRFEILYRIFDDEDQAGGLTIHDFGCGYGALFDFLKTRPVMSGSQYIGSDLSTKMLATARASITDPRARFLHTDKAAEPSDYTFVSGTFNMNLRLDYKIWTDYVKNTLTGLWDQSHKGLAFNMLRLDAPEQFKDLYYADPEEYLDFCKKNLSPTTTYLVDDNLPDWTILVKRP